MLKILIKAAFFGIIGLVILGGPQAQEKQAGDPRATGLIPLDAGQIDEIVTNWPRIARVGVNRLGFERVNEVRAGKGKAPLDPSSVAPVGAEVESSLAAYGASLQTVTANEALADDLPVSVDNSQLRYFPPIRDQGRLGACVSFALTYTQMSYMTAFQRNLDIRDPADNTNKYSPKWTYNMLSGGQDSGSTFSENYDILEKHGAATWAEFPYDADFRGWCMNPAAWRNALGVRTKDTQYVSDASTDAGLGLIKELLADGYVLVFGTYIGSWGFMTIADDVSTSADDIAVGKGIGYWLSGSQGPHAMTIVGYNDAIWTDVNSNGVIDAGEKGALRIANSWGTGWGDAGFTWLAYDALKSHSEVSDGPSENRIEAFQGDMVFVLTARNDYSPLMIAEFTVSHAKRNQIGLKLSLSDTSRTYPTTWWTPAAFQRQGGALAFDGSSTAISGTFDLDFSDILVAGAGPQRYYLSLDDNTEGDPATLSAFKIVDFTTDPPTEVASSFVPQTADHETMFPYVEYSYAGPDHNDPPKLSSLEVFPPSGGPGDTFRFDVHYSDPEGDVPSVKSVVIDGTPQPMTLVSGYQPANGMYRFVGGLPVGAHSFYCHFEDGRGESVRAPLAGSESGPCVYSYLISGLVPGFAMAGGPSFVLTVNGSDFPSGSVVTWDGSDRPTTFVSSSRVDAEIGADDLVPGRMSVIAVWDPTGGYSRGQSFTVSNPFPSLRSLSPRGATGGGSGLDLTLQGSGFVSNSVALWNGLRKITTYVSSTELRTSLSAFDLGIGGQNQVTVINPEPNGGTSSSIAFSVSDFTIYIGATRLNTSAGQPVSCGVQVGVRNGSFDSAISFGCSGLPRGCTASFSPATLTPGHFGGSTTLTIVTTSRNSSMGAAGLGTAGFVPPALAMVIILSLLSALAVPAFFRGTALGIRIRRRLATAILILLMVWLAGCGAGGNGGSADQGTPAGVYQLLIQAYSGSLTQMTYLTLAVQ